MEKQIGRRTQTVKGENFGTLKYNLWGRTMEDVKISVIMPCYNQCSFVRRAILSLMKQTYEYWELIIVNDGSTDELEDYIADYLDDDRILYIKNPENTGLGHALNQGLDVAHGDYIAYLPADDYYYEEHLSTMIGTFCKNPDAALVYSGIKWDNRDSLHGAKEIETSGIRKGYCLQLVQVVHRKTEKRWVERGEWVCEDYFLSFWQKLLCEGDFVRTNQITAFWTQHPGQRHRIISERYGGGLNKYRSHYHVRTPVKIKVSKEKFVDEETLYFEFRKPCAQCEKPLKILLVGELAYNSERIYALEEAGHILYGLWCPFPNLSFSTVGPLPFGHVADIPLENWQEEVRHVKPDIIYGMLNWDAIDWTYDVVRAFPYIPFAWHYKEGPHVAIGAGNWHKLVYLYRHASVKIYLNKVVRQWFGQFLPLHGLEMVMDGDLPKQDYFKDCFSEKLSSRDGEIHTLIAGRMIGLGESSIGMLARNGIHVHLYLENFHASRAKVFAHYHSLYPEHFHLHNHCAAKDWTREFSKYDAAWLHCINSKNGGSLMKATWDDLNIPARISSYAAAGLPVISPSNEGCISAITETLKDYDIGILFDNFGHLIRMLHDRKLLSNKQENMMRNRRKFSFDYYVPEMTGLFRQAIEEKGGHNE